MSRCECWSRRGGGSARGWLSGTPIGCRPAPGSAAAVIYVHVLHLVADIPATLAEARRVLTPGGQVVAICTARGEPADDADRLLESLRQLLTGPRADAPDRLAEAACRAGLAVVHEQQLRHDVPSAPADYARSLQERLWSWTWDIDDGTWAQLVAPVISELRSMPHADQARSPSHSRSLFVLAAA